jgi:diacylglycerol kinase (ATP)
MARALLITNPDAARTDPRTIRSVRDVLARRGLTVEVAGTTASEDATELARRGVRDGAEIVAVYGGDGTTMRAVRGIVGLDVALGLIPGGTGNVLAGNLRIPRSPVRAAEVVAAGKVRAIDLGRVEREDDGVHYFAVNCGAGADASLMAATSGQAKRRWGFGAYVAQMWQQLGQMAPVPHRITVDGELLETDAATVLVANCGEVIPPFLKLGADIAPDDGLLDVVVLSATGLAESVGVLWQLARGTPNGSGGIQHARGHEVRIEATPARPVQLDGEPTGCTPLVAAVMPGAIRVLVPRGS